MIALREQRHGDVIAICDIIGLRSAEDYAVAIHICVDELINILGQHAK